MKYFIMLVLAIIFTGCVSVGEGYKIGQVVKINEASGILPMCKTVEIEIIRGGFNGGSGVNGSSLSFTVENNPEMLNKLKTAMTNGQEVEVKFKHELVSWCRSDSNSVFGLEVKIINDNKHTEKETLSPKQQIDNKSINNKILTQEERDEILRGLIVQNDLLQKLLKD